MKWRRLLVGVLSATTAVLVTPPLVIWGKQMMLAKKFNEEQGHRVAAQQLYRVFEAREGYLRSPDTLSHPYSYPYVECDTGSLKEMGTVLRAGAMAFQKLAEQDVYMRLLADRFSTASATGLTACIEASVLAPICANTVRHVAYDSTRFESEMTKMLGADYSARGRAYCREAKAIISSEQHND